MKKVFLITLGVLAAAGMLYLGYVLKKAPPSGNAGNNASSSSPGLQDAANGTSTSPSGGGQNGLGLNPISDKTILNYFVGNSGVVVVTTDGEILGLSGKGVVSLSSSSVPAVSNASFSFDGGRVLVGIGEPTNPAYRIFDLNKKSWQFLPYGAASPVWSPNNNELAYLDTRNNKEVLNIINTDKPNSKAKQPTTMSLVDTRLDWPIYGTIILEDAGSYLINSSVWKLGWSTNSVSPLVFEQQGVSTLWEKGGSRGLVLTGQGRGGALNLVDTNGNSLRQFSFITMPEKCVFNGNFLFCGVPSDQKSISSARLPDAYQKESLLTSDDILKIDLNSGDIKTLAQNSGLDAIKLKVNGNSLYFIDRITQKAYSVPF